LRRRGGGIGVASICGGLAQGDGAIVKVEGK
jgi:acetyl-CoA C-acetyltransferase